MGGLVSAVGIGPGGDTGAAGSRFQASGTNLISPASKAQLDELYGKSIYGIDQQREFMNALNAQNGIQNQSDIYNQLGNIASGQGPNPAQAALNQATANNIANQAALMAGQRGAGANAGLIARQAAQQGGNLQQQAIGQGATLQAQQALNAIGQQGNIAGQQVQNLGNATQGYNQAVQSEQNNLLNAVGNYNNANVGMQSSKNKANSDIAGIVAKGQQDFLGNIMGAGGSAMGLASGGEVPSPNSPRSNVGQFHLYGSSPSYMAKGGKVSAMVSPGEAYIPPKNVANVAAGADPRSQGEMIPGKAKVKGDSLKNDTVPKELEEGGFVIPRSIMESDNVKKNAAAFVAAHLAKNRKSLPKKA